MLKGKSHAVYGTYKQHEFVGGGVYADAEDGSFGLDY